MSDKNNTHRADLRNTLLSNGYTPLPLLSNGKGLYIKGWSRQDVDSEWLAGFARRTDYLNTGLRCDRLAAFDLDILDPELCDAADGIVADHCGATELCRFGQDPKRLLLYQLTGKPPFKSLRTAKYEGGHRGELLCGNGRQFAAFGTHPSGSEYEWEGASPLDLPFKKLPKVDYATAQTALDAIGALLAESGLKEESPGLAFGQTGHSEHDLTDDFECFVDGAAIPWGELKDDLTAEGVFGNIRREDGEFGDSDAVHFMLAHGSQQPCIHDFVRDCTHWDLPISPDLAKVLPDQAPVDVFTPDGVADLLENWVLLKDGTVRHMEDPQRTFELSKFKAAMQHIVIPAPTQANPLKTEPAVNAWQRDTATLRADYAAMRPDEPDLAICSAGSMTVFNTYAPPEHPETGGETDTVREFIEHLIPDATERGIFWDWHALKVAHPSYRMHALITVTRAQGTGRGTWFQILERLLGGAYVRSVELSDLIGTGSQGAFNDYLADALVIYVPETLEEKEDQSRWLSRHLAYERLKLTVEPVAAKMYIKRKYGKNTVETVYSSLLLSSNHIDALAIEPNDRRVIVLDNTEKPLWDADANLIERIHVWQDRAENIGALHRELRMRAMSVAYDPFGTPPDTPAKSRMIEAGQSDTDMAFEYMVETASGDLVTPAQWRAFAQTARTTLQLDLPIGDKLDQALTAVIQKRGRRIESLPRAGLKIQGSPQRPWIIRNFDSWKGSADNAKMRAEVLKNGAPGGSVVQFPPKKS